MDIYLGLDIGGTKCSLVVGDKNFEIKHKITFETRTERGYKLILDEFMKHIDHVLTQNKHYHSGSPAGMHNQTCCPGRFHAALCVAVYEDKF